MSELVISCKYLGKCHQERGDFKKALVLCDKAHKVSKETQEFNIYCLGEMGICYRYVEGHYDEAIMCHAKALLRLEADNKVNLYTSLEGPRSCTWSGTYRQGQSVERGPRTEKEEGHCDRISYRSLHEPKQARHLPGAKNTKTLWQKSSNCQRDTCIVH